MTYPLPKSTLALVLRESKTKPVYHHAVVEKKDLPALTEGHVLVKMGAAAMNHREVIVTSAQGCRMNLWTFRCGSVKGCILALPLEPCMAPTVPVYKSCRDKARQS